MEAISIKNFKYGIDTRREQMASLSGVLAMLTDGHINQGGECEQRKAFVAQAGLLSFGLEVLGTTMVTFGSAASPGGFPADVTYQRLRHPDGTTVMTKLVFSTSYAAKAAAIAKFADGAVFAYYDGLIISDNIAGLILPYMATATAGGNAKIANQLKALIDESGYFSSSYLSSTKLAITNPSGVEAEVSKQLVSAAGTLTVVNTVTKVDGIAGVSAQGQFSIQAGAADAGNSKVSSVKVDSTELLGAAVNWVTSNAVTAAAVKDAINAFTGTSGYTATVDDVTIMIKSVATGVAPNGKVVKVTSAKYVCVDQYSFAITMISGATTIPTLTSVFINGVDVLGGAIAGSASLEALATAAATAIIAFDPGSGKLYASTAVGNVVYISRLVTLSNSPALSVMVLVNNQGGIATTPGGTLIVTPGPTNLTIFGPNVFGTNFLADTALFVNATGGTPPYIYEWSVATPGGQQGFDGSAPTSSKALIQFIGAGGSFDQFQREPQIKITRLNAGSSPVVYTGYVFVLVTDSTNKTAGAYLQFTAKFYPYA